MPGFKKTAVFFSSLFLSIIYLNSNATYKGLQPQTPTNTCTFYRWFDPNTTEKEGKLLLKNCSSCHMAYYDEWINDKHSMSQNNPFFLSVYKDFKKDHPDKPGNCSLCHNPEAVLSSSRGIPTEQLYAVDLRKINSKKTSGISCDFCHKIEEIDQNPLKKGVAGLKILRTCKGMKDIRMGPIKDPIPLDNEELRYNSIYKTSLYCAKCHEGSNGNVQTYSTFSEWLNSPAAKKGVQCQSCHMVPRSSSRNDMNTIVDNPNVKHKKRPYYEIHNHRFLTNDPHEFRKKYVGLNVEAYRRYTSTKHNEILTVKVIVTNNNFGHSFPTGSPMRNAVLLVEAKDKNGKELKLLNGPKLPVYAGNLKGKPGKLFAKILSETSGEYATQHGKAGILFRKAAKELGIPAQDWWNIFIASDTRIKANENDMSIYEFAVPRNDVNTIKITTKLIWRNTWPGLAKLKRFELKEDLLIEKILKV